MVGNNISKSANGLRIIWLGPVLDQKGLSLKPAVSPAANRWQLGLIQALQKMDVVVTVVGYLPEPAWPRGRLHIEPADARLPSGILGQLTGYWNLPAWRNHSLSNGYRKLIQQFGSSWISPCVVITYNGTSANVAGATYARKHYGIPWVCIVGDDWAPKGADGYVFLSWGYYEDFSESKPKLHLDGGVSKIRFSTKVSRSNRPPGRQVVMYAGSLNCHAGVDFLARAFHYVDNPDVELWICGKGSNLVVERTAAVDARIKIMGFLQEQELEQLAQQADAFVNPRPSNIPDNERNFPSKVLEYLSFGKPVISTWTAGLSPEYRDVLVILEEETENCLAYTIEVVLNWDPEQRQSLARRIARFLDNRLWPAQAKKLTEWLTQQNLYRQGAD